MLLLKSNERCLLLRRCVGMYKSVMTSWLDELAAAKPYEWKKIRTASGDHKSHDREI